MDVRRAPRIGHRLDGAEAIASLGISDGLAEVLETGIDRRIGIIVQTVIAAERVALSDFHLRIGERLALDIHYPAR